MICQEEGGSESLRLLRRKFQIEARLYICPTLMHSCSRACQLEDGSPSASDICEMKEHRPTYCCVLPK